MQLQVRLGPGTLEMPLSPLYPSGVGPIRLHVGEATEISHKSWVEFSPLQKRERYPPGLFLCSTT